MDNFDSGPEVSESESGSDMDVSSDSDEGIYEESSDLDSDSGFEDFDDLPAETDDQPEEIAESFEDIENFSDSYDASFESMESFEDIEDGTEDFTEKTVTEVSEIADVPEETAKNGEETVLEKEADETEGFNGSDPVSEGIGETTNKAVYEVLDAEETEGLEPIPDETVEMIMEPLEKTEGVDVLNSDALEATEETEFSEPFEEAAEINEEDVLEAEETKGLEPIPDESVEMIMEPLEKTEGADVLDSDALDATEETELSESFEEAAEIKEEDVLDAEEAEGPESPLDTSDEEIVPSLEETDVPEDTDLPELVDKDIETESETDMTWDGEVPDPDISEMIDPPEENAEDAKEEGLSGTDETPEETKTATQALSEYMNEHNYGINDQAEYMQDPEWRRLSKAYREENGLVPLEEIDEAEDHVDDVRAFLEGRGLSADSSEMEAILENERQGIKEIIEERDDMDDMSDAEKLEKDLEDFDSNIETDPEADDDPFKEFESYEDGVETLTESEMVENGYPSEEIEVFDNQDVVENNKELIQETEESEEEITEPIEDVYDEDHFAGLETGKMENGMSVIKGAHYDDYLKDYYDYDNYDYESLADQKVVEVVNSEDIEGVHLGQYDIEDPDNFWNMHHRGSKEFFDEAASHIPEVHEAMQNGARLEDLRDDERLGKCASLYYDPENMPKVEKINDYYTFDTNGRHRIIAARRYGYDIPVHVIGIRKKKA